MVRQQKHPLVPVVALSSKRQRLWVSLGVGFLNLSTAPESEDGDSHSSLYTLPLYNLCVIPKRNCFIFKSRTPDGGIPKMYVEPCDAAVFPLWSALFSRITGRLFEDYYKLGAELARGSFATVHKATKLSDGSVYAVKYITISVKRAQTSAQLANETRIMADFGDTPGLMGAKEVFHEKGAIYIVMDLYAGGSLKELICDYAPYGTRESTAGEILRKLGHPLAYMHAMGIAHRDVKLENCICKTEGRFPPDNVVLADFGFSIYMAETSPSKRNFAVGTPVYVAPEAARNQPHGFPVDIYALGVLTYRMLASEYPVEGKDDRDTLKILAGNQRDQKISYTKSSALRNLSPHCISFLKATLQWNANKRISARGVLVHRWIQPDIFPYKRNRSSSNSNSNSNSNKRRIGWKDAILAVMFVNRLAATVEFGFSLNANGWRDVHNARTPREVGSWTAEAFNERMKRASIGKENALGAISSAGKRTASRIESVIKLRTTPTASPAKGPS